MVLIAVPSKHEVRIPHDATADTIVITVLSLSA